MSSQPVYLYCQGCGQNVLLQHGHLVEHLTYTSPVAADEPVGVRVCPGGTVARDGSAPGVPNQQP